MQTGVSVWSVRRAEATRRCAIPCGRCEQNHGIAAQRAANPAGSSEKPGAILMDGTKRRRAENKQGADMGPAGIK
jgi:hypothetical protein